MHQRKAIVFLSVLGVLALSFSATSLAQTREISPTLRRSEPNPTLPRRTLKKVEIFQLVNPSNEPIAVSFNQCVNAAKSSCTHGVDRVDHEEATGNCSFGCLAAPSNSNN